MPYVRGIIPAVVSATVRWRFQATNTEARLTQDMQFSTVQHRLSMTLTGKGILAPFTVELFTAPLFTGTPRQVQAPATCITARRLPAPAHVERPYRDFHPNCSRSELWTGPRRGICKPLIT
ncbi:MAG: hypothetical protein MI923_25815 [Phycisphaerales bacterium]|nr:hypothetical protein [Phycisphaerales bacterium]